MRLSILEDVKKEAIKKYDELKDYTNSNDSVYNKDNKRKAFN